MSDEFPKKVFYRVQFEGDAFEWVWDGDRGAVGSAFVRRSQYNGKCPLEKIRLAAEWLGDGWEKDGWRARLEAAYGEWRDADKAERNAKTVVATVWGQLVEPRKPSDDLRNATGITLAAFRRIGGQIALAIAPLLNSSP